MKYKIIGIYHSGRKGTRYDEVTDYKYDGLIGSIIDTDKPIEDYKEFEEIYWNFISSDSLYACWHTSAVIGSGINSFGDYVIETINSIYVLEKVNGQQDERNQDEADRG